MLIISKLYEILCFGTVIKRKKKTISYKDITQAFREEEQ